MNTKRFLQEVEAILGTGCDLKVLQKLSKNFEELLLNGGNGEVAILANKLGDAIHEELVHMSPKRFLQELESVLKEKSDIGFLLVLSKECARRLKEGEEVAVLANKLGDAISEAKRQESKKAGEQGLQQESLCFVERVREVLKSCVQCRGFLLLTILSSLANECNEFASRDIPDCDKDAVCFLENSIQAIIETLGELEKRVSASLSEKVW